MWYLGRNGYRYQVLVQFITSGISLLIMCRMKVITHVYMKLWVPDSFHFFVIFGTYYVSSCFRYCRGCFCVIVFLLLLLLFCCCWFFVALADAAVVAGRFLLLLSLLLYGCCCVHYYRCQDGCWCWCCCCCVVVTSVASLLCPFLCFFDFIKFKLTLNFCNYLFRGVALFYFILQGIK